MTDNYDDGSVTCPFCGHEQTYEYEGEAEGDVLFTSCDECEKEFEYTMTINVTYWTHSRKPE